jgi:hypothetical protein
LFDRGGNADNPKKFQKLFDFWKSVTRVVARDNFNFERITEIISSALADQLP